MHATRITSLFALALGALACSSNPDGDGKVDLGDRNIGVLGEKLEDFSGEWEGYTEAFTFRTFSSDRVRLSLDSSGRGTLKLGDKDDAPPLPEDPRIPYPLWTASSESSDPIEGFAYEVHETNLEARRFRFGVHFEEGYDAWCAGHVPVQHYREEYTVKYSCTGGVRNPETRRFECFMIDPATGEQLPMECSSQGEVQCGSCECDAEACHAGARAPAPFDGALENDGESLVGSMIVKEGQQPEARVTVRLARVSP